MRSALVLIAIVMGICSAFAEGRLSSKANPVERRLLAEVGLLTRVWIRQEAARDLSFGINIDLAVRRAAVSALSDGKARGVDIDGLMYLLLIEASHDADAEIVAIVTRVKAFALDEQPSRFIPGEIRQPPRVAHSALLDAHLMDAGVRYAALADLSRSEQERLQLLLDARSEIEEAVSILRRTISSGPDSAKSGQVSIGE